VGEQNLHVHRFERNSNSPSPTIGNQGWFEYGGRLGFRLAKGWVADLFANGTLGPQPVGNTIHGGVELRVNY
jgi:hypothetical protein